MKEENEEILLMALKKLKEDRIDRINRNENRGFGILFLDVFEYDKNPEKLLEVGIIGKFMGKDVILK